MVRSVGVFIGGGLLALLLVSALSRGPEGDAGARAPERAPWLQPLEKEVARLRGELALEREGRVALSEEVAQLRDQLEALAAADEPSLPPVAAAGLREPLSAARRPTPGFDEEVLFDAGFDTSEVRAYRSRLDEIELERLYLRDRAEREGWLGTPRFAQESAALVEEMFGTREEFGDELYDWVLYASGHSNRVEVTEVMEGSPAAAAGLQTGDTIARYDERLVLSPRELRDSTSGGEAGALTPIDVVRGAEELRVYVPRGPLGVRIAPTTQEPPRVR